MSKGSTFQLKSYSDHSTLKGDMITIKIPENDAKVKAIIEMPNYDAWLDQFDILSIIESLFEGLNEEQKTNTLQILGEANQCNK